MLANNRTVLSTGSDKYSGYTCRGKRKSGRERERKRDGIFVYEGESEREIKDRLAPSRSRCVKRNSIDFNEITILLFYY